MATITFPLDADELTFPLDFDSNSFPLDFDRLAKLFSELVVLCEVDWEGDVGVQTEYYSFDGVRPNGHAEYEDLIDNITTISRELAPLGGQYNISDMTIRLKNRKETTAGRFIVKFSSKKAIERFYNIPIRLKFGDPQDGLATMATVFTGRITDWEIDDDGFLTLSAHDISYDRFNAPLTDTLKRLLISTFPDIPMGQKVGLVPVVVGDCKVNSDVDLATYDGGGPVPCYLIDENAAGKWRYVVAQHVCKEVTYVFRYGVRITTGFTVTTASYDGVTMTIIDFDADQRDSNKSAELEITAAVKGITSDGTPSGTLIENVATALKTLLTTYAATTAAEFDSLLVDAAVTASDAASYKCAMVIHNDEWTWNDVIQRFKESFLLDTYVTKESLFGLYLKTHSNPPTPALVLTDSNDILRFRVRGNPNNGVGVIATHLQYNWLYNWVRDYFEKQPSAPTGVNIGSGVRKTHNVNLWGVRDSTTAVNLSYAYMDLLDEDLQYIDMEIQPSFFRESDLNTHIGVTHWAGIAGDGNGYDRSTVRVFGMNLDPQEDGMIITLKALKQAQ